MVQTQHFTREWARRVYNTEQVDGAGHAEIIVSGPETPYAWHLRKIMIRRIGTGLGERVTVFLAEPIEDNIEDGTSMPAFGIATGIYPKGAFFVPVNVPVIVTIDGGNPGDLIRVRCLVDVLAPSTEAIQTAQGTADEALYTELALLDAGQGL